MSAEAWRDSNLAHPEMSETMLVTSDNFNDYLLPGSEYVERTAIDPHLYVPQFTASYQRLYDKARTITHGSENDVRATFSGSSQVIVRQRPFDTSEQERDQFERECSQTIYYDPVRSLFDISDITIGTKYEVAVDVYELMGEGKNPLLPEHTHPGNSMATPEDYVLFRQQAYPDGSAAVRAFSILCPDMQILVIATKDTPPPVPEDQVKKELKEWNARFSTEDPYFVQKELEAQMGVVQMYSRNMSNFFALAS